jgi:hypothetical protein
MKAIDDRCPDHPRSDVEILSDTFMGVFLCEPVLKCPLVQTVSYAGSMKYRFWDFDASAVQRSSSNVWSFGGMTMKKNKSGDSGIHFAGWAAQRDIT